MSIKSHQTDVMFVQFLVICDQQAMFHVCFYFDLNSTQSSACTPTMTLQTSAAASDNTWNKTTDQDNELIFIISNSSPQLSCKAMTTCYVL